MHIFKKSLSLPHLPTWMLIIGFPVYWLELFFHHDNHGVTTSLATILFTLVACIAILQVRGSFEWKKVLVALPQGRLERVVLFAGTGLCLILLSISLYAAFLPPHLVQEEDIRTYHYTFPRLHLIHNSLDYIHWSTCDLFPYPVQSALAPFWFVTEIPNKVPQFLFLLAIPFLMVRLLAFWHITDLAKKMLIFFAFLGAHHVGIQAGTAMLDLVLAYLFLAALDSFLAGNWILAAIEGVFYFWSKSFIPFQMTAVLIVLVVMIFIFKKFNYQIHLGFAAQTKRVAQINKKNVGQFLMLFCVLSVFIAGPFIFKSLCVAGTPLYPFFSGTFPQFVNFSQGSSDWQAVVAGAQSDLSMKDAYGLPRTVINFVKHFWLVAVPTQGVNNIFDYPLGLVYLLCLGPFIWFMGRGLLKKQIGIIPLFVVLLWLSWWFGSQQSRFLYVPLLLLYLVVIAEIRAIRVFSVTIVFALFLTTLSVYRAHKPDFGQPREKFPFIIQIHPPQ